MHGMFDCRRVSEGELADEEERLVNETVDYIAYVTDAGLDDLVREMIREAYDAVGYDGDSADPDLTRITLQHIAAAAHRRLKESA